MTEQHNHDGGKRLPFGVLPPGECPACDEYRKVLDAEAALWKRPEDLAPRCYWCGHPSVPRRTGMEWVRGCNCGCHE